MQHHCRSLAAASPSPDNPSTSRSSSSSSGSGHNERRRRQPRQGRIGRPSPPAALPLLLLSCLAAAVAAFHPPTTTTTSPMLRPLSHRLGRRIGVSGSNPLLLPPWRRHSNPQPYQQLLPLTALAATTTARSKAKGAAAGGAKKRVGTASSRRSQAAAEEEGIGAMNPGAKLVIVESATKANTIRRYLPSSEWEVDFCMGHVRCVFQK